MVSEVDVKEGQLAPALKQLPTTEDAQIAPEVAGEPEQIQDATPEVTDWKAEAERYRLEREERDRKIAKLENDLRSKSTYKLKQDERDDTLLSVKAQLDAHTKALSAVVNRLASGETEGIDEEIRGIQAEVTRNTSVAKEHELLGVIIGQARDACLDESGNPLLDLENAPELEEVRRALNSQIDKARSGERLDLGVAYAQIPLVYQIATRKERMESAKRLAEARKAEREAKKEALDAAGIGDLSPGGGGPSSSANVTTENIDVLYVKNPEKYEDQYRTFLNTGRV